MFDLIVYDTESTDADVKHAQIVQFAAVRADKNLNVLEDMNIRVRRLPWMVPAPGALRVIKLRPEDLDDPYALSEYEASGHIEKFMVPGYGVRRVFLTFNGIRFDDELIRSTQFRNLRNPWVTSGKLATKVDLLPILQLVAAADPDALIIPLTEDGKKTWRLERVCPANGIEIDAHDAGGDALATLQLARLIKERAPWAWDTGLRCGLASSNETLLAHAAKAGKPLLLFRHFGEPDVVPCAVLGTDGRKKWILSDLRKDVAGLTAEQIASNLYEKGSSFPIIRSNASPIFLDAQTARRINPELDFKPIMERARDYKRTDLSKNAISALKSIPFTNHDDATPEEKIYGEFVSDKEKPTMTSFHRATSWQQRLEMMFEDTRLKDFSARIMLDAHLRGETTFADRDVEYLKSNCANALDRPFSDEHSRFMTIAKAVSEGADEDWVEWSKTAFLYESAMENDLADDKYEDENPVQMEMRF